MTKHTFTTPDGNHITSIIMDQTEYNQLCDHIHNIKIADTNEIQKLKEAKHIPLMKLGTKTKPIFDKYKIKTQLCSFIIRGTGIQLLNQQETTKTLEIDQQFIQTAQEAYNKLPPDAKTAIEKTIQEISLAARDQTPPEPYILRFINTINKNYDRNKRLTILEQTSAAIYQTRFIHTNTLPADQLEQHFTQYLRRLLTGIAIEITPNTENN
jgi:hypothetical protein